jgi:drug/metabolite transporter (DMT)-like permease
VPPAEARPLTAAGVSADRVAADLGLPGPLAAIAKRPRLAALLGATCIAFSGIFYRWAEVTPSTGTVFRALFGLPLLGLVAWLEHRRYGGLPTRTVRLALLAGVLFAGDLTFWHHAIAYVGVGLATVLANLQVIIVGVVAWLAFGERPSRNTFVALPIVLLGVALISGAIGGRAFGADPGLGVVLGLACALCYAGYLLIIRRGGRDLRRPAGPVAIATVSTAAVAALVGVIVGDLDPTPAPASLAWLAILGLTSQSLGYLLISLSLSRLPAVLTSIILLAQPVMTVVLGIVLLHEAPTANQLLGVVLVIGGIGVATLGGMTAPRIRRAGQAKAGA